MKQFLAGVALGAALLLILAAWWDEHETRKFIEREQMTVRPVARWRRVGV